MANELTVQVRGLVKGFGDRRVLDGLELAVRKGEFVALLGRSGSGKSTLLRILSGLDKDITGESTVDGTVSVAFQQPRLLEWRTVWRNIVLGLKTADPRGTAERALAEVQLADRADAWPRTLSGGEAQRVSLARALVREPDLLLLDEPFAALDALTRIAMHRLVSQLWAAHRPAVLLVTHDVDEAIALVREPDLLLLDEPFAALDALTRIAMHRLVSQLWAAHRPAVLLVTHDVDEAIALADRILVLDSGRIVAEHLVTEPHQRLRTEVLADLGVNESEVQVA